MKLQRKRNAVQGRLGVPLLALCIFLVACLGALKCPGLLVSSQPNQLHNGVTDYGLTTHSLCGRLPLAAIGKMIPSDMVYFQRRWKQSHSDWALALTWLVRQDPGIKAKICDGHQHLRILLYFGAYTQGLTGLDGSPQGEQIQWHDLYISLLLLGYHPTLGHTRMQLTAEYLDAFDLVIIDYDGVNGVMDQVSLNKHRCKLRVLDSWGTDAGPNMRDGYGFCCLKLPSLSQFWTFTPGFSPENSFLGYRVASFRKRREFEGTWYNYRKLRVLLYGKEYSFFSDDLAYIKQLSGFAPTHATAKDVPVGALPGVHNHGVLAPNSLHTLMQSTFAYAGFAAVMMGPAAIEALSNGMIFLNYAFVPPRNLSVTLGKPTTQLWTSQFPFLEHMAPHAITINTQDARDVQAKLGQLRQTYEQWWVQKQYSQLQPDAVMGDYVFLGNTRGHRSGYVPYEYTTVAMLLRVNKLIRGITCR